MIGRGKKHIVGFTMVELVIVVVIIAILAALTTIAFTGIADKARKNSFSYSAQSVLRAIIVKKTGDGTFDPLSINETNVTSQLQVQADNFSELTMYNSSGNDYIYIVGKNNYNNLTVCGTQTTLAVYNSDDAACALGGSSYVVTNVNDSNPGGFGGGDGSTCTLAYTIDSVEDLVYFSNQVDGGNNYLNKCIKLATSLDIAQSKSYVNSARMDYGDINGDGTTEGLKKELTTGAGFNPAGSDTAQFRGTFKGELNTIYNLLINRPAVNYVGFIAQIGNAGNVSGLNLIAVNVTGGDYTGGLTGRDGYYAAASEISVSGNVTGGNRVGLFAGSVSVDFGTVNATSISVEGNVVGADYVGGITGHYYVSYSDGNLIGINKGGTIIATGSNAGRISGYREFSHSNVVLSGLALSSVTVKGSTITSSDNTSINGSSISNLSEATANINTAEMAYDTYIGGDNDNDGYYWDYNGSGVVVQRKISDYPISFTLSGSGTSGSPYLINNYAELKQASTKLSSTYKLMADIDMSSEKYYMIGSYPHAFTGKFDGNLKTLSNITINSPKASYLGFVGYNKGIIQGLNLTNISVAGSYYVGGITGLNDGATVTEISVSGNVTGGTFVSLGMGRANGATGYSIITDGNVTGNDYVGGIVGYNFVDYSSCKITGVYKNGSITATTGNVGRISGGNYFSHSTIIYSGLAKSSITINGSTVTNTDNGSVNGSDFSNYSDIIGNINFAELALDTYIGGDSDNNGYYWDYDGSTVIQKKVSDYPLTFTLSGSGTSGDPYLVNNYADLRQASQKISSTIKLMADIDMTGNNFYMFGSYPNAFTGKFDGNLKTISNISIYTPKASYIGFCGLNRGTIQGIKLTNINITGSNHTGGIAGYNDASTISEDSVQGSITGGNNVGMIAGTSINAKEMSVISEGSVTGVSSVGGIIGYAFADYSSSYTSGINKGGSIIATGANAGRAVGQTSFSHSTVMFSFAALSTTTVNGSTVTNTDNASLNGSDFNNVSDIFSDINATEMTLDTYIGGDNDNNGYYWDYDGATVTQKRISDYPLTFALSGAGTAVNPYLVYNYADLRQASQKTSSTIKLMADIDMAGNKFYMFGGYFYPFTGKFDGGAKTISNISINAPKASHMGFVGRNQGLIEGLYLTNISIAGSNNVGGLVGYNNGNTAKDSSVQGSVSGYNCVGLGVGYSGQGSTNKSIVVSGNASGNDYIGGLYGQNYADYSTNVVTGIYKSGSVSGTGSNVKRMIGWTNYSNATKTVTVSFSALSSITVKGSTVTSSDPASFHGIDVTASDLNNQTTYSDRGFNFTDEALDYIWYMDAGVAKFREGTL